MAAGSAALRFACVILSTAAAATGFGLRAENPPHVAIYVSADEQIARPILKKFEQETGIKVDAKYDTEATKTAGLVNLIRSEADRPRADVFWSSEVFMTIQLANENRLEPLGDLVPVDWPKAFRDPSGYWIGFAARARVIAYSKSRVAPEDVPRSWTELTHDNWKDRIVMADPRFGTTRGHMGAMKAWWERHVMAGYFDAWFLGLAENHVRLLTNGNAGVVQAIASGEADIGMTDTDDVWAANARGADLGWVYPVHILDDPRAGTLVIPNTVAMIHGAANPEPARRLIAWLISADTERALASSDSRNIPIRPGLAAEFPLIESPQPLEIDFASAAAEMEAAVKIVFQQIEIVKDTPAPGALRKGGDDQDLDLQEPPHSPQKPNSAPDRN